MADSIPGAREAHAKTPDVEDVIAALERFRTRTAMYIHPVNVPKARSFLYGLRLGVLVFGIRWERDVWWQVQETRGWQQRSVGPVPQMKAKGITSRQIIDELIDIEIETLRRSSTKR
jgi:hypothetical protein